MGDLSLDLTHKKIIKKLKNKELNNKKHLDIGCGDGSFIYSLKRLFPEIESFGIDYTEDLIDDPDFVFEKVDVEKDKLPFPDDYFDLVTLIEVIEHIYNYDKLISEIKRVLRPESSLILSTPNILSMKSRVNYLFWGFHSLFGPLKDANDEKYSTAGHVNPISFYYIDYILRKKGFSFSDMYIDKRQSTSIFYLVFLIIPLCIYWIVRFYREKIRLNNIDEENTMILKKMMSIKILTGRTLILKYEKV